MLIQAASGLERLMGGTKGTALKDSTVAQISAYVYYNAHVISKLSEMIFKQINEDFGNYIDSLARSRPKSLHHVYEWGKAGNKSARLFDLNLGSQDGLSFKISYSFKPSTSFVPVSSKFKIKFAINFSRKKYFIPLKNISNALELRIIIYFFILYVLIFVINLTFTSFIHSLVKIVLNIK